MYRFLAIILFITSYPMYYVTIVVKDTIMWLKYGRFMTAAETEVFTEKISPSCIKASTFIYALLFVYFKYYKR
jgi:hypothetical protein